ALQKIQPTKDKTFDLHFNIPNEKTLPYFDQAIQHINSGYPRLWVSWVELTRDIDEYNENQARDVEGMMEGVVISKMRELFTQPPPNMITTFQNEFFVDTICDEISNFWVKRFIEFAAC